MPFRSAAQRRWMFVNNPAMARRWAIEQGGMISIDATQLGALEARLEGMGDIAPSTAQSISRQMAEDLVILVKKHASGRPGPEIVTGAYQRSIRIMDVRDTRYESTAVVGSMAPQMSRLEFGFVGIDALGRHYQQPPFPHWRPAMQDLEQNAPKYMHLWMEMLK